MIITNCFERLNSKVGFLRKENVFSLLKLIITKIRDFLGLVYPRIPDDGVGEVVLLDAHFPARHHVGDDVLRGGVGVDPISVLPNHYYISTFLKNKQVNSLLIVTCEAVRDSQ